MPLDRLRVRSLACRTYVRLIVIAVGCPAGRHGYGCLYHCECPGTICDHVTGKCICNSGTTGIACEKGCKITHYGVKCSNKCECLPNGGCHFSSGTCKCDEQHFGAKCSHNVDKIENAHFPVYVFKPAL
ncbi:Hypothetical predicted protein [Paramuricea clavata]|uniref:Uncharacterized protein n=1 Tax=Paramuricea clavata TaxID=317549 RepID=A0A6S7G0C0_PARCT|nr:Hypothetical predicted protein [Paramuricea clavata]